MSYQLKSALRLHYRVLIWDHQIKLQPAILMLMEMEAGVVEVKRVQIELIMRALELLIPEA